MVSARKTNKTLFKIRKHGLGANERLESGADLVRIPKGEIILTCEET